MQCDTCRHAIIQPGDWVPYGSTSVQTPSTMDCSAEFREGELPDETYDPTDLATKGECPRYESVPECSKHPGELIHPQYGCGKCEEEYWGQHVAEFENR